MTDDDKKPVGFLQVDDGTRSQQELDDDRAAMQQTMHIFQLLQANPIGKTPTEWRERRFDALLSIMGGMVAGSGNPEEWRKVAHGVLDKSIDEALTADPRMPQIGHGL
jgi:hypothetical protein